jgi:hypothetical protein
MRLRKLVLCLVEVAALVAAGAGAASRPAVRVDLADLPGNTWVEVKPKYEGAPNGGQVFPMGWNNKGAYDPQSGRVLVFERWYDEVRKGTIYANAVLAYDPATNVCTVLKVNNWKKVDTNGYRTAPMPENAADPTPVDRHPLGSVAVATDRNALYLVNGLNQTAPGNHPNDTWAFDLTKRTWTQVAARGPGKPHPPNVTCDVMTCDPQNKVLVLFTSAGEGTQTWLLDPAKGEWKAQPRDESAKGVLVQAAGIACDSKRGLVVCFGGGRQFDTASGTLLTYSVAQNRWTRLKDCPAKIAAPGFDYDSKHDVFLAIIRGATWAYSPERDEWTEVAKTGVPTSAWKSITYNAAHDVFVYQGGTWDKPLWMLFRYAPPGSAAASAPAERPKG